MLHEAGAVTGERQDRLLKVAFGQQWVFVVEASYPWASVIADVVRLRRIADDSTVEIEGIPRERLVASSGTLYWNDGVAVWALPEDALTQAEQLRARSQKTWSD